MHPSPRRSIDPVSGPLNTESSKGRLTLLITGPSLEMQQKLVSISGLQPTIILGSETLRDSDTLPPNTLDLIADAILHRDVRAIVVCGHPSDVPCSRIDQCSLQENMSRYNQMLQRIRDRMERQQRAQDRVRKHLEQFFSNAMLAFALNSRAISLFGMSYIPESDVFLIYDSAGDRFVPIVEAGSWHS